MSNRVIGAPKVKPLRIKKPGTGSHKRRMRAIRGGVAAPTCKVCAQPLQLRRGWLRCSQHGMQGTL